MKKILALLLTATMLIVMSNNAFSVDKKKIMKYGKKLYTTNCSACHQMNGAGIPGAFPPLAKSDFIKNDEKVVFSSILLGNKGKMTVNGVDYNGVMPPVKMNNKEIAAVTTFIMNSWGNKGKVYSPKQVKKFKKSLKK